MSQAIAMRRSGMSEKKVATSLGLSRQTVKHYNEGQLPPHAEKDKVLMEADMTVDKITKQLEVMVPEMLDAARGKIGTATFKDLLIGSGIGIEKLELLKGRPTSREGRQVVITFSDPGAKSLRELGERALSGTPALPEGVVEGEIVPNTD